MCRSLKVLCAAPGADGLAAMKRGVVSATYELVGGATSAAEIPSQVGEWHPDVLVVDAEFVAGVEEAQRMHPIMAVIVVGGDAPDDAIAVPSIEEARAAIGGTPRPGGPVR